MPPEALLALLALWWALADNLPFLKAALQGHAATEAGAWMFAATLVSGLFALHLLLLVPLAIGRATKSVAALLVLAAASASFYVQHYGVYLDPTMLRNAMHTNRLEAGELLGGALWLHLGWHAGPPLLLLAWVRLTPRRWTRSLLARGLTAAGALGLLVACVLAAFQPLASLMRNQRELRYLITPANLVWSGFRVAGGDLRAKARPRQPIGLDAVLRPAAAATGGTRPAAAGSAAQRPKLVVLVVGETARAANWGLSGYARQTTPQLASLPVLNFTDVTACGTNTETSLPCMFAPVGRRQYDEERIIGSESLLHVAARAGVQVLWRDNQSGCKGVCDGLPSERLADIDPPGLCRDGRCLDEGLLHGLPRMIEQLQGTHLVVLHPLGNHGPAYFKRYPAEFARWGPACESEDLRRCSREQIVDAYDNALLYTDHQLAGLVRLLQRHAGRVDSALIYVSDHGESLGEGNLFLHGLPYAIAPAVQTRVPMVMWLSEGLAAGHTLDLGCLARRTGTKVSHDHLFHTLLGLLDVRTALYEPAWDLADGCRGASLQASAR